MICSTCGNEIPEGAKFCPSCGTVLNNPAPAAEPVANEVNFGAAPAVEPVVNEVNFGAASAEAPVVNEVNFGAAPQPQFDSNSFNAAPSQPDFGAANFNAAPSQPDFGAANFNAEPSQPDFGAANFNAAPSQPDFGATNFNAAPQPDFNTNSFNNAQTYNPAGNSNFSTPKKKSGKGTASLIMGICATVLGLVNIFVSLIPFAGIVNLLIIAVGIVGMILGIKEPNKGAKKTCGIIFNIAGIFLSIIAVIVTLVTTITALVVGKATVDLVNGLDSELTSEFGEDWKQDLIDAGQEFQSELENYESNYDYDDDSYDTSDSDYDSYDSDYDTNAIISSALDSMNAWNSCADIRDANKDGQYLDIIGEWLLLSNASDECYVFNAWGEYWYYKSYEDRSDNYWYGKYDLLKGKDGIDAFGLNSSSVGANSDVPEDNYYAVTLYPEQIISGGVDKSDTNIPEGMELKYVWVVIDHGDEGIEGQLLDLNGATYDTYEYVKAAD